MESTSTISVTTNSPTGPSPAVEPVTPGAPLAEVLRKNPFAMPVLKELSMDKWLFPTDVGIKLRDAGVSFSGTMVTDTLGELERAGLVRRFEPWKRSKFTLTTGGEAEIIKFRQPSNVNQMFSIASGLIAEGIPLVPILPPSLVGRVDISPTTDLRLLQARVREFTGTVLGVQIGPATKLSALVSTEMMPSWWRAVTSTFRPAGLFEQRGPGGGVEVFFRWEPGVNRGPEWIHFAKGTSIFSSERVFALAPSENKSPHYSGTLRVGHLPRWLKAYVDVAPVLDRGVLAPDFPEAAGVMKSMWKGIWTECADGFIEHGRLRHSIRAKTGISGPSFYLALAKMSGAGYLHCVEKDGKTFWAALRARQQG
jgi:hypothetical protein